LRLPQHKPSRVTRHVERQGQWEIIPHKSKSFSEGLYLIFGGILAAILTAFVILGLRVPMLGDWRNYALVVGALLFASLGIGFLISLVSQGDSQAVQLSMIVLLATVFFSGFFLRLDLLWEPVRVVAWLLPATYGILLLQDILLRGPLTQPYLVAALLGIGVTLFFFDWLLLRRQMARL
jgi:ABC-2 type transport system permease protein